MYGREIFGCPEANLALNVVAPDFGQNLVVHAQKPARLRQKDFTVFRQNHVARVTRQQRHAHLILEAAHLQTHG